MCQNTIKPTLKIKIPKPSKKKGVFAHTTKFSSYMFNFDTKQIEHVKHGTSIEFSKCSLNGLDSAYTNIINNLINNSKNAKSIENYYVVCPIYSSKSTKKMLDTQLAVTGKCYFNEKETFTAIREIQEELGISCNSNTIKLCVMSHSKMSNNGIKTEATFTVDVSDSRHFDPKKDCVYKGHDDRTRRVQIVVWGKLDNLLNMYTKIFNRPESNDLETIRFVRIVSLLEFV